MADFLNPYPQVSPAIFDRAAKAYIAAIAVKDQRKFARQMETILLNDTPVIIPYFYDFLTGVRKGFSGVETTGMGHVQLTLAGQTA